MSLTLQPLIFKLMCSNGWIMEQGMRRRHVGRALEEGDGGVVYRSDTRIAEAAVQLLKIRDRVAAAIDEARFRLTVGQAQELSELAVEEPERCVEVTASRFGLSPLEKERVLREFLSGSGRSVWDLTDAITSVAQAVSGYARATELEEIGGRMLSLPTSELRELAGAN
jgi:hypothetical protein